MKCIHCHQLIKRDNRDGHWLHVAGPYEGNMRRCYHDESKYFEATPPSIYDLDKDNAALKAEVERLESIIQELQSQRQKDVDTVCDEADTIEKAGMDLVDVLQSVFHASGLYSHRQYVDEAINNWNAAVWDGGREQANGDR